ncbi:MAG: NAD(P)/FAD-dependent oxidoreductase [Planctomycetes bacterium]|nr:NAD(P)/FAD-dependent oxidoreductase [Planctomycetota bacterium]
MNELPPLPAQCDVVVVGGGLGGLTSAAVLAKSGLSVCVLEAAARPGGYLSGYDRHGFVFDTAIHWLNECGPNGMVRRMFDFLGPGAPATPPLKAIRRYKGESFDYLLTNEPDRLRDQFARDFPEDEDGIHRLFALAKRMGARMAHMSNAFRSPATMNPLEKMRYGLPMAAIGIAMLRHNGATERKLSKYIRSAKLRAVFCSEERFLSVLVPIGWAYHGNYQQPPAGGSQEFPMWLCRLLDGWGSTVSLKSRVSEILVEHGRAVGVRVTRGKASAPETREIRARYVIAACDLATVYRDMLPQGAVPQKMIERLETADLYESSFTVSLGLDCPSEQLGFGEELVYLSKDGIARQDHQSHDPHLVGLSILAPSLRDPTMAPPGKGTVTVHAPARMADGDHWKTGPGQRRGPEYKAYKQQWADVVIDRVAKAIAPDLRQHIELCEVATPFTHRRYTGNRDGSIMAAKATGKNIRGGVARYQTPVQNLLLGGHWAEYGGGVPVAVRAGANSALFVLKKERPRVFQALKHLLDGTVKAADVKAPELREAVLTPVAPAAVAATGG